MIVDVSVIQNNIKPHFNRVNPNIGAIEISALKRIELELKFLTLVAM